MQIASDPLPSARGFILGVDASNIRAGGGVTHLSQLLAAAHPRDNGIRQVIVWGGARTLEKLPEGERLRKIHAPLLDRSLPWRLFWQQLLLPTAIKRESCDVLFSPGGTSPARVPVPNCVMSQNLLPFEPDEAARFGPLSGMRLKLRALYWSQSRSMRKAAGLIFLTRYARARMLRVLGQHGGRIAIIPHGVEDRFFAKPRPAKPSSAYSFAHPFRLIYVSIVDMYKHQWQVASAIGQLRRKGLPITIEFIGPGCRPAVKRLLATIEEIDPAGDFLHYIGPVAFPELHKTYQTADAFVFASSCENLPNILLEAMAAGLPIACSNRGPMPEVLGDAGLYFDPERPAEIAAALEQLFLDSALRARLAVQAQERARDYSWQRCARETFSFIEEVAQARAAR